MRCLLKDIGMAHWEYSRSGRWVPGGFCFGMKPEDLRGWDFGVSGTRVLMGEWRLEKGEGRRRGTYDMAGFVRCW